MSGDGMLRITPEMEEDEILLTCAEAVLEALPDRVIKQPKSVAPRQRLI